MTVQSKDPWLKARPPQYGVTRQYRIKHYQPLKRTWVHAPIGRKLRVASPIVTVSRVGRS